MKILFMTLLFSFVSLTPFDNIPFYYWKKCVHYNKVPNHLKCVQWKVCVEIDKEGNCTKIIKIFDKDKERKK